MSFRLAVALFSLFFATFTAPFWLAGGVIAPHALTTEVGVPGEAGDGRMGNRRFSDFARGYIPYLYKLHDSPHAGWLATWDQFNELGRPLLHGAGFSSVYFPTWLLSFWTTDPYVLFSVIALSACYLGGLFMMLWCRELGLAPLAGLIAGLSLATSPSFMWWLAPFPMFVTTQTWSVGLLFAATRLAKGFRFPTWAVLAFCAYSLLMTGHPQIIVIIGYLLGGALGYLAIRRWQTAGPKEAWKFVAAVVVAMAVAGALSLPYYIDLANLKAESARFVAPDANYFTSAIPTFKYDDFGSKFLALSTFQEIFGNPVLPDYQIDFGGHYIGAFGPVVIFLCLFGILACVRRTFGWWAAAGLYVALIANQPLYLMFVRYLGLNMSRALPTNGLVIPLTVLAAYGADALVRRTSSRHRLRVFMAAAACLIILGGTVAFGMTNGLSIRWGVVDLTVIALALMAAQGFSRRSIWSLAAVALVAFYFSAPMALRVEAGHEVADSPLVAMMQANLPAGGRYAVVDREVTVLWPEINAQFGMPSVHSYNGLTSRRYHALIESLGGEMENLSRLNRFVRPDFDGPSFWMSNIALVLSSSMIAHRNLEPVGSVGGIHLYRVISRMGESLQVLDQLPAGDAGGVAVPDLRPARHRVPLKLFDQGDAKGFSVEAQGPSLLVLSHQYHEDWRARGKTGGQWLEMKTVPVNGVFQGVLLPAGVTEVEVRFLPVIRLGWVGHLFWMAVLGMVLLGAVRQFRLRPGVRGSR